MRRILPGKKKLAIGMVGLGFISDTHSEAYKSRNDVYLKAISDSNHALLLEKGRIWGIKETYPDYKFMLMDKEIDVVDVMTPHYMHKKCVCDALGAGKVVICEKPLATSDKDVEEIIRVSKLYKRQVYVKQYLRFSKCYQKARKLISKGSIGFPYFIQATFTGDSSDYINPFTWRANSLEAGGGVFIDIGVHMLDILLNFFGYPLDVYAQTRKVTGVLPHKGEDLVSALIGFPGGRLININCTQIDKGYGFRWDVVFYGLKGVIRITDTGKEEKFLQLIRGNKVVYEFVEYDWWRSVNIACLNDIIKRIKADLKPKVQLSEAKIVLKTIMGAYRSARLNRKVYFRSRVSQKSEL